MKVITEELLKCFFYDVYSPSYLSWNVDVFCGRYGHIKKVSKGNNCTYSSHGRYVVMYKQRAYQVSRIVYFLHYPDADQMLNVDHIDGNPFNNLLENLRLVSQVVNMRNVKKRKTTVKTGVQFRVVNGYEYYIARYTDLSGKKHDKIFSCLSYGKEEAEKKAIEFRDQRIKELNKENAQYTERHGT